MERIVIGFDCSMLTYEWLCDLASEYDFDSVEDLLKALAWNGLAKFKPPENAKMEFVRHPELAYLKYPKET